MFASYTPIAFDAINQCIATPNVSPTLCQVVLFISLTAIILNIVIIFVLIIYRIKYPSFAPNIIMSNKKNLLHSLI
jgi:hypothetical protein